MSTATILYMDVEAFSSRNGARQKTLIEGLTREVEYLLRAKLFPPPGLEPQVIALPSGDGLVLVFRHDIRLEWSFDTILELIHRLQHWGGCDASRTATCRECSENRATEEPRGNREIVRLRFGIHVGQVEMHSDIYRRSGICGHALSHARQLVECADGAQLLLSDAACEEYLGPGRTHRLVVGEQVVDIRMSNPLSLQIKPGESIQARQICVEKDNCWNSSPPRTSLRTVVAERSFRAAMNDGYLQRLGRAKMIAFVQGGTEALFDFTQFDLRNWLTGDTRGVWVFIAETKDPKVKKMNEQWKKLMSEIKTNWPEVRDLRLLKVEQPLHYSASFLDWECQGGRIDLVPSIYGVDGDRLPSIVLEWCGDSLPHLYDELTRSLSELRLKATDYPVEAFANG